jgi:hypothetical protein
MKLKLMLLLNVSILSLLVTGCGQNLNGSYTGLDQITQSTTTGTTGSFVPSTGQNSSSAMTMNLTQNGDSVTGTWSDTSTGLTGSIQGTMSGGSLGSITMMSTGTGTSISYGSSSLISGCTFTGSLNYSSNQLSGSLGAINGATSYGSYSQCTGITRTLQLNQSSN